MSDAEVLTPLTFTHPRGPKTFEADVGHATTGEQSLDGLRQAGFLGEEIKGPFALQLSRTGESLALSRSLIDQGARSGDAVAVLVAQQGGAP
jgi:hypothetical protein